jgi:decaprenylphospho-beta-D-ribofuranose 2-oxidase
MGLTGVILAAGVQLQPVQSALIDQVTLKAANLREIFELFEEYASFTYSVAWIDCLAKGDALGRSLLMVGEHRQDRVLRPMPKKPLSIPIEFPSFALNPISVALFNTLYYHRIMKKKVKNVVDVNAFFYPLDAIGNWNRIYGKNGFTQYQCVLPTETSYQGLHAILRKISEAGLGSFLAVLKLFGAQNDNLLSFPRAGYTLALDFKIEPKLFPLLDVLDRIVLDHGGRIYLTKDVRMRKETFEAGYPRLDAFRALREKLGLKRALQSLQSKRLEL